MIAMIIINGLLLGGITSVLAVGFSLVFGVAKIVNLAHTAFYMIATFLIFIQITMLKLPLLLSLGLAVIITTVLGMACYKLFLDRVKEHEAAVMIISVALATLFQEVLLVIFGARYHGIPRYVTGFIEISGVRISNQNLLCIGATAIIICGVLLVLWKSRIGYIIRAVAQDREIANLMGIDVSRLCMITVGVAAGLAGLAAAVVGPVVVVVPYMWAHPLVMVLAAVILGGLGSIKGSIIGAFILGFVEASVIFLFPTGAFLKGAVSLGIMLVVLLIRPEGLFGVVFEEERL